MEKGVGLWKYSIFLFYFIIVIIIIIIIIIIIYLFFSEGGGVDWSWTVLHGIRIGTRISSCKTQKSKYMKVWKKHILKKSLIILFSGK